MLRVVRLDLHDFRNHARFRVEAEAPVVALVGPNGAGKTNVLEALTAFTPGRGLRGAKLAAMTRRGAGGGWTVSARLDGAEAAARLGAGLQKDAEGREKRVVRVDGESAGAGAVGRALPMLWLTPQMDRLFTDPPAGRRRFLDRLVFACRPEHAGVAGAYDKAMRERNRLLADGMRPDPRWLDAVERTMAEAGVALAAARGETLDRLAPHLNRSAPGLDLPTAQAALDAAAKALADGPAAEAEDRFAAALRQARARDAKAGRTLEGPHRADLLVRHVEKDAPAAEASTGEQKALLLALVMAQARLVRAERGGPAPLLLLDEWAAHLDEERRGALADALLALGSQIWTTGTDAGLFAPFGSRVRLVALTGNEA